LIGGHSVGHVHIANSGYGLSGDTTAPDGILNAWDDTPDVFDNHFFNQLLTVNWYNMLAPSGTASQWFRHNLQTIMLNSDIALSYDANTDRGVGVLGQICGPFGLTYSGSFKPGSPSFGCSPNFAVMPATCSLTCQYANDLCFFLDQFSPAWERMVDVGYGVPASTNGATASGKLGTLTTVNLQQCYLIAPTP